MIRSIVHSIARFLPLIAVVLVVLQIIVANELAGAGHTLSQVDEQIQKYAKENEILDMKIASASSLLTVEAQARVIGFVEPQKDSIITERFNELPIALQHE